MDVRATVRAIEGAHAWVEVTERAGGCGRCDEPGGCRAAKLGELLGPSCRRFRVANPIGVRTGETVRLSIPDGAILGAAWAVYVAPVLGLLAGAGVGSVLPFLPASDAGAALGAVLGLLGGALIGVRARRRPRAAPTISRT